MRGLLAVLLLSAIQTPTRHWRELLVVHGDDMRTEYLETLTRRSNVTWLAASKATREDLARGNVVLAGTLQSNRFIRELAPDAFAEWYDRPGHVVQIVQRNPLNRDYRMSFVVGAIERPVRRRRADVHIRHHGRTILLAFAGDDATFETRRFEIADQPQLELGGFRFFVHGFEAPVDELRRLVVEDQRADVHVYRSLEEKGLITDDTRSAHVEDGVFHIVLGVDERPARFIAENLVDDDAAPLLVRRGLAAVDVYDAKTLDRFDETARRVLSTTNPPSLAELVDDERFLAASPFVTDALSASFARFVGDREFDIARLERSWSRSLVTKTATETALSPPPSFQRGVTYAHMGYQIHNGYLSARSDDSLSKLGALGIDAVSVVPYTFMQDPNNIVPLDVPTRAGSETDEGVIHAIRRAQALGMSVMVKPQIWVRRGWPGDIDPESDADEERFFHEYRLWIRHYALMAEAYDVPLLAIGTELTNLTKGHCAQWESIIEDIRCVYGGKLVYAANWGAEVQNVDFWDLLDYIGVDFSYPG